MDLKEGEVICSKCDGKGVELIPHKFLFQGKVEMGQRTIFCSKCDGNGKLDWVENIVGKETRHDKKFKIK